MTIWVHSRHISQHTTILCFHYACWHLRYPAKWAKGSFDIFCGNFWAEVSDEDMKMVYEGNTDFNSGIYIFSNIVTSSHQNQVSHQTLFMGLYIVLICVFLKSISLVNGELQSSRTSQKNEWKYMWIHIYFDCSIHCLQLNIWVLMRQTFLVHRCQNTFPLPGTYYLYLFSGSLASWPSWLWPPTQSSRERTDKVGYIYIL